MDRANIVKRAVTEILELHQFFVHWFTGELSDSDADFARIERALAEQFHIISPRGVTDAKPELLRGLRGAHGKNPQFRIWIENCQARFVSETLCLMTYEEWQESAGETSARLSSALFAAAPGCPNELQWLHLHETWLPIENC
ncbi:hypothetical protein JYT15_00975 [Acidimicrobium ferrooxidans]|nr:hypothetical protein [Acidimicrobium ferrooxidans]